MLNIISKSNETNIATLAFAFYLTFVPDQISPNMHISDVAIETISKSGAAQACCLWSSPGRDLGNGWPTATEHDWLPIGPLTWKSPEGSKVRFPGPEDPAVTRGRSQKSNWLQWSLR